MASSLKNLSEYVKNKDIDISNKRFAIVVSDYYTDITESLFNGVVETLLKEGAKEENIFKEYAPGTYELTLASQYMAQLDEVDAVICLGCVIQGETKHFDFICHAVAQGLTNVSLKYDKPVIFGVLTPNTMQQALDRAGGKHGNKGVEAAMAAVKMLGFNQ
ncbi:6,7-dimethyl-8-ribityllumazine synthase [Sediminitomix flava]|uniref:6,7-dimethyl-8-ribityllumazine synthase n=1 Tax=Sediminitomix flava TaxID=379075 RepID=A0A315ZFR9_SEDFL|nr:6,7-dimethyl-8-ribityllumazine synthase [Sediminitomix flava]PWJ44425.1 6,7-dimethyl-8-ribityllumazine synthase [Sediminitomix flava]